MIVEPLVSSLDRVSHPGAFVGIQLSGTTECPLQFGKSETHSGARGARSASRTWRSVRRTSILTPNRWAAAHSSSLHLKKKATRWVDGIYARNAAFPAEVRNAHSAFEKELNMIRLLFSVKFFFLIQGDYKVCAVGPNEKNFGGTFSRKVLGHVWKSEEVLSNVYYKYPTPFGSRMVMWYK